MAKEMAPIVLTCGIWGSHLTRHSVLFECNNSSVVAMLSNGIAKDDVVMHLLWVLWFFIAHYDRVDPKAYPGGSQLYSRSSFKTQHAIFFLS